ncbi:cysteine-rich receptor-like protein kinase, partial [Trifolium medium]|nr:cysteine-rich receptor-like protein kinase [Trifolium medium]
DLAVNKSSKVAEMSALGWEAQSSDIWQWQPDLAKVEDLIWHKQVPLKVSILAWRLLRDRLPTKHVWFPLVFSPVLDRFYSSGSSEFARSLSPVHSFFRRLTGTVVLLAAYLASMCLDYME